MSQPVVSITKTAGEEKLWLAAMFLVLGLGCSAQPPKPDSRDSNADVAYRPRSSEHRSATRGVPSEPDLQPQISLESIGLAAEPSSDQAGESWDSEHASRRIEDQLKRISRLLTSTSRIERADVERLVENIDSAWPLRPRPLELVFEDSSLLVHRDRVFDERMAHDEIEATNRRADFVSALQDWRQPLIGASHVRCKFKVFSIDVTAEHTTTDVHVHMSGRNDDGVLQISAVWNCRWTFSDGSTLPRLVSISATEFEQSLGRRATGPLFTDCTEAVLGRNASFSDQLIYGLDHWLGRLELGYAISASGYQGLSVADVNGDGLDDLYVCRPGGLLAGLPNLLFLQKPDGTAEDVSESSQVDWQTETHSALFIDLDNDGDQDLVAATVMGLVLAANNGQAVFTVKDAKLTPEAAPISLAAADFDNDGDLDIYAGCYSQRSSSQLLGRPVPYHDANNGGRNLLLRNDGQWRFSNVTKHVGLEQNNRRFTLACAWEDFDNDGDQDLYVSNDYGRNNLYRNEGGKFRDIAAEHGVEDISAGMSTAWGDFNRDGWMDIYVSNMWSSAGNRIAYQRRFMPDVANEETRFHYRRHARGNTLFMNKGLGARHAFADVSIAANVARGRWAWSSNFFDINNDSLLDLYVANGFITQENPDDL